MLVSSTDMNMPAMSTTSGMPHPPDRPGADTGLPLLDLHGDVHAGDDVEVPRVVDVDPHRDHLGHLGEVPGGVGLGEQGEDAGGATLPLAHRAGQVGAR